MNTEEYLMQECISVEELHEEMDLEKCVDV